MNSKLKALLLIGLIILFSLFAAKQAFRMYNEAQGLNWPTQETRLNNQLTVQRWLTVQEVAKKYNTTEQQVFIILAINPVPGDEKLSLRELKDKYRKTNEEMQNALQRLIDSQGSAK